MKQLFSFIALLSLLAFFGNQGGLKLYRLKKVEKRLTEKNHLLFEENVSLRKEMLALKDKKYIEHLIREDLGFVKENETIYDVSDENFQSP